MCVVQMLHAGMELPRTHNPWQVCIHRPHDIDLTSVHAHCIAPLSHAP